MLGGIDRARGALVSGMLIGLVTAWNEAMRMEQWTPVLALGLLVIVLVLRPEGIGQASTTAEGMALDDQGLTSRIQQRRPWLRWVAGGLVLLALLYPLVDQLFGFRQQLQLVNIFFFVILALGLTITLGFAGVLNLGYSACFAVGAYTTTFLTSSDRRVTAVMPHVDNFVLVFLFSVLVAGAFGMFLATTTRHMQVGYVAVVSLSCAQIVQHLLFNLRQWTGRRHGLAVIPPPDFFGYQVRSPTERYYMVLGLVLITTLICTRLRPSRLGRAWRALGDDRLAAISLGVPAVGARRDAIVLGAMIAGTSGALYASMVSFVDPERASFLITMLVVGMVVIGGAGDVLGAVLGAVTIAGIDQVLIPWLGARIADRAEVPGWQWLDTFDVRAFNLLTFGLAVYIALYLRTCRAGRT